MMMVITTRRYLNEKLALEMFKNDAFLFWSIEAHYILERTKNVIIFNSVVVEIILFSLLMYSNDLLVMDSE